ncbi:MAG: D-aminoacyl-tRNA deacylase [Candidatus Heimdallarchaeota archaeon]|nr:MAG: D-aminoacyl-tRNA deacylase [Candidatus Heimdallarchaeota archaeon]
MTEPYRFPILLLVSRKDIAGMNIFQFINDQLQEQTVIIENDSIYSDEEITKFVPIETSVIFLSRHSARSLRPSFTVHPIGNFGKAEFGGKDTILGSCQSFMLKRLILNVRELANSKNYQFSYEYEISIEVTHHGPFSHVPVTFIEVGSSESQWKDLEACRLIADTINGTEFDKIDHEDDWVSVIGFGGNHYATKFNKQMLETEYAFGHICAKYALPMLNEELIQQMILKTNPRPEIAFFDKKSMKRKQLIRSWLSESDIDVMQI